MNAKELSDFIDEAVSPIHEMALEALEAATQAIKAATRAINTSENNSKSLTIHAENIASIVERIAKIEKETAVDVISGISADDFRQLKNGQKSITPERKTASRESGDVLAFANRKRNKSFASVSFRGTRRSLLTTSMLVFDGVADSNGMGATKKQVVEKTGRDPNTVGCHLLILQGIKAIHLDEQRGVFVADVPRSGARGLLQLFGDALDKINAPHNGTTLKVINAAVAAM